MWGDVFPGATLGGGGRQIKASGASILDCFEPDRASFQDAQNES